MKKQFEGAKSERALATESMMPTASERRSSFRWALPTALLAACPGRAHAEGPGGLAACEVTVQGVRTPGWALAVARLEQDALGGSTPVACQRLVLRVHAQGATLEFRAQDGPTAVRALEDPSELEATVAALSVVPFPDSVPPAAPPNVEPDASALALLVSPVREQAWSLSASPASIADDVTRDTANTSDATTSISLSDAALVALEAGMRVGADRIATPYIEGLVALSASRAELGVTARYEPWYYRLGSDPNTQVESYGLALGVRVARRQPANERIAVILGGQAQVATVVQERTNDASNSPRAEARVGVLTGLVARTALLAAFRATLGFEVLPHTLGRSVHGDDGGPLSPWWGVTLGVGGEFGGA